MSTQPKALRLADAIDYPDVAFGIEAAAELRRLNNLCAEWEKKAATWLASPEAAKRLDGYRELAQRVNTLDAALREQVIRMAREAGMPVEWLEEYKPISWGQFERFFLLAAAAGAAAEREACAKVCDDEALRCEGAVQRAEPDEVSAIRSTAWKISVCAAAIRARGEK